MIELLFKGRVTRRLWIAFALFLWTVLVLGGGAIVGLALAEKGVPISLESEDGRWRAFVKSRVTLTPPRQDLWLRDIRNGDESRLARLAGEEERCVAVVWSADSQYLAFLLEGTRLLVFAAEGADKRFDDVLVGDGRYPGNRCVRGLRFLPGGEGVRYEVCHRWKAGAIETRETRFP